MPGGDGTGPVGYGPMSGRGLGCCAGYGMPGYMAPAPGRGMGHGMGRGWGRRRLGAAPGASYAAQVPPMAALRPEYELRGLKAQAEQLQASLAQIQQRIADLEGAQRDEQPGG